MNMNISRRIYEGNPDNRFIATAQKIAIYTVSPIMMIMMFEAIIKNLIFINLANTTITLINTIYDIYPPSFTQQKGQVHAYPGH